MSPAELQHDPAALGAALVAMSLAVPRLSVNQMEILEVTSSQSQRRLDISIDRSQLQGSHLKLSDVTYELNVTLESFGYSFRTADSAYAQITDQITSAVVTGKFQEDLKAAGQTAGVTTFANVVVNESPMYTPARIIRRAAAPPTVNPSSQPTPHVNKKKRIVNDDDSNVAIIAGGTVGVIFFLALGGCLIYYLIRQQQPRNLQEIICKHSLVPSKGDDQESHSYQPQLSSLEPTWFEQGYDI